jgi:hypothetical protein
MMSFVVSGAFLWYFAMDEYALTGPVLTLSQRVSLNLKSALFRSFGTLAKVAVFAPFSESILHLERWAITSRFIVPTKLSLQYIVYYCIYPFIDWAHINNSHYLGYCALFGVTLNKAGTDLRLYPELAAVHAEDVSGYVLNSIGVFFAGIIAIVFGVLAKDKDVEEWPLFFLYCFYLSYTGLSFSLYAIKSGVDAMIIASIIFPTKVLAEFPIIFSRFKRLSEFEMR